MRLLNYSLDNLSMMALTSAIGFVVDDAIVMLENIMRPRGRRSAARRSPNGSKEIGFTILAMTTSLAAVSFRSCSWGAFWATVSRVCRHDLGRHLIFGRRVRHPDAHALQPILKAARKKGSWAGS